MLARVLTVILVALADAAFRVTTLVVDRLAVPVMFAFVPKRDATLRVNALPLV